MLGRAYGLASENLQAVHIVTADGTVRTCSATQNSDLFWACRGGGGGNFGIATSFTFRTHHLTQLVQFFPSWPWSRAARVVAGWQSWAPFQPDALWSNVHLSAAQRGGTPVIQVGGTYLGSVAGCQRLLSRLYTAVGARPVNPNNVFLSSYRNAMLIEAGCSGLSVSECHLPSQTKNGRLPPVPSFAKSDFFTRRIPAAGIRDLVAGIERMRGVRGAAGVSRQHAWLRSLYVTAHQHTSGQAYQNYEDPDLKDWEQAYYGRNFTRLTHVKAKYDPHQVFKFPQGIPPG